MSRSKKQIPLSPPLEAPLKWTPINHHGLTEQLFLAAFSKARRKASKYRAAQAEGAIISSDIMNDLSEQLVPLGWHFSNVHGRLSIVCPDNRVQVAIASGNEYVGRPDALNGEPLVNIKRAKHWWEEHSAQLSFALPGLQVEPPKFELWLGLYHRAGHEVRVELSHAEQVDDGFVKKWGERHGLPPIACRFSSTKAPATPTAPRSPATSVTPDTASRVDGLMKPRR